MALTGAALKSKTKTLLATALPTVRGEVVKTGKRGRPIAALLEDFANDYLRELPDTFAPFTDEPDLIAGLLNALADARRTLDEAEAEEIEGGRDAEAMGLLDGEPVQADFYTSHPVRRHEGESLGLAFQRRIKTVLKIAQMEADDNRQTLYVYVCRYAIDRNARDAATAKKYGMSESLVGLMSRNIVGLIITSNPKAYKGALPRVAVVTPQPKAKASTVKGEAILANA